MKLGEGMPRIAMRDVGQRYTMQANVKLAEIAGKGVGLIATKDLKATEQILFISKPLAVTLSDAHLPRESPAQSPA